MKMTCEVPSKETFERFGRTLALDTCAGWLLAHQARWAMTTVEWCKAAAAQQQKTCPVDLKGRWQYWNSTVKSGCLAVYAAAASQMTARQEATLSQSGVVTLENGQHLQLCRHPAFGSKAISLERGGAHRVVIRG